MKPQGPFYEFRFSYEKPKWPDQIDSTCRIFEDEFPSNRMDCAIVMKGDTGEYRKLENRLSYLKTRHRNKYRSVVITNYFSCVAAKGEIGPEYPGHIALSGSMKGNDEYSFLLHFPPHQSEAWYADISTRISNLLGGAFERRTFPAK